MSNYSPVSSAARAFRKGLPTIIVNRYEVAKARLPQRPLSQSRTTQYRYNLRRARVLWDGNIIMDISQKGRRRKDLSHLLITLELVDGKLGVVASELTLRNPHDWGVYDLPISITSHAIERMAQRQADTYMEPMKGVLQFFLEDETEGTWEVGCSTGMTVVAIEEGNYTVITFVDADKLRPAQPAAPGVWRRVEGQGQTA